MISNVEYHTTLGASTLIILKLSKRLNISKYIYIFFKKHNFVKEK
jgi:hypothetical protein